MHSKTSDAGKYAAEANQRATQGRLDRDKHLYYSRILHDWQTKFANDPVGKYTLIFFILFMAEIFVSFGMNRDFVHEWHLLPKNIEWIGAVVFSLILNGLAAICSQLYGKRKTAALTDYEIYNKVNIMHRGEPYPEELAAEKVAEDTQQDWKKFWYILGILMLLVGALTYQRLYLLMKISDTPVINWMSVVMPLVILLAEIWTGIYVTYCCQRLVFQLKNRNNKNRFLKLSKRVAELDRLVVRIVQFTDPKERVQIAEIFACIFRAKYRTQDSYQYIDEVAKRTYWLRINLISLTGQRIGHIPVIGLLYEGNFITGVQFTDSLGNLLLEWEGFVPDQLDSVVVAGQPYPGPFRSNHTYTLRVPFNDLGSGPGTLLLPT